jgi:hypothetical protein
MPSQANYLYPLVVISTHTFCVKEMFVIYLNDRHTHLNLASPKIVLLLPLSFQDQNASSILTG